jgi:hypothetical protein
MERVMKTDVLNELIARMGKKLDYVPKGHYGTRIDPETELEYVKACVVLEIPRSGQNSPLTQTIHDTMKVIIAQAEEKAESAQSKAA